MPDGNMTGMSNPLKVSIALGQKPAIIQKGPFYLMKPEPIVMSEVTGATNLMASKNLEHSFQKLACKWKYKLTLLVHYILFSQENEGQPVQLPAWFARDSGHSWEPGQLLS